MSNRKIMQAPSVRRGVIINRRAQPQVRGIWDWLIGGYWRGG